MFYILAAGTEHIKKPTPQVNMCCYLQEQYPTCLLTFCLYGFHVLQTLCEETNGEAIITTGVGQHQMWAAQWYKYNEPRRWASSGGLGSMGFGLPSALGAAVAYDGTDSGRPKKVTSPTLPEHCLFVGLKQATRPVNQVTGCKTCENKVLIPTASMKQDMAVHVCTDKSAHVSTLVPLAQNHAPLVLLDAKHPVRLLCSG